MAERITGRVIELAGEVELLRKQLADAEHELERLVIVEQVVTQLMTAPAADGEPRHCPRCPTASPTRTTSRSSGATAPET